MYAEHWPSYFKFSIVRSPVSRFLSMLKYPDHFGVKIGTSGLLEIEGYLEKFGFAPTLEHDHRFTCRRRLFELSKELDLCYHNGTVYRNRLGGELDRVFLYEDLEGAIQELSHVLGLDLAHFPHLEKAGLPASDRLPIDESVELKIRAMHDEDYRLYGVSDGFDLDASR